MNISALVQNLCEITKKEYIFQNEDMKRHTTFKTGGPADIFVVPQSISEAAVIVRLLLAEKIPYRVIGNGSNLLVSDKGYRGVIICLSKGMDSIEINGNTLYAQAGALLSKVCYEAYEKSLSGLVFASGIPGSVGGAVCMNAGAYGGEMKDVITKVDLLDCTTGETVSFSNSQMGFSYRTSIVKEKSLIVLGAEFSLASGDKKTIKEEMDELSARRREKQPLEYPSAGSTFKRPEGYFAGKLIEDSGLRGYSVGGAMVSDKHCGFVINKGGATSEDIITLIRDVRRTVSDKFGVLLEPEVCLMGEDFTL